MHIRVFKYAILILLPALVYISLTGKGVITAVPVLHSFLLVPFVELFTKPDPKNLPGELERSMAHHPAFDWVIYLLIPFHFTALIYFLNTIGTADITAWEKLGRTSAMGLLCGVLGINMAHELGHRTKKYEQHLARLLLLTSLYQHFFIEHNEGHHRNVGTPEDPATARKNESIYAFWVRSIVFSYLSAWKIETKRLKRKKLPHFSIQNRMLKYHLYQALFLLFIYFTWGLETLAWFGLAALFGVLLLETVNYIEHYGLMRKKVSEHRYEKAAPGHSWNSNHIFGRLLLFELTRHSDHHYEPQRKYQVLRHHDNSPQLPAGYPAMMLLSLFPPLWFRVMNKKIVDFQATNR